MYIFYTFIAHLSRVFAFLPFKIYILLVFYTFFMQSNFKIKEFTKKNILYCNIHIFMILYLYNL